jgi:hypothetical protein
MGYPDLKSDESIVLTAQHVKVKSVPFELVLTNRRLIIIDSEKNVVPTQQIQLFTIRNVMASENAIRDPVITLTILTDTADTREMALTFVRQTAGERRREADEWVKSLRRYIALSAAQPADMGMDTPAPAETRQEHAGATGIKKKIEIAGPIKKIMVDTSHMPPRPIETTSLPEGSFCGRCGNRIPPGSTFCNRCGTKVTSPADVVPAPVTVPQAATAPVATAGSGDRKGRPLEEIIHSIEPLIADSVPRTETAAAIPEPAAAPPAEAAPATPADAFAAAAAAVAATGQDAPNIPPVPPLPPVPAAPRKKSRKILAAAIIIIVILAVVAGGFVVMSTLHKTTVVTPVVTTVPTTAIPTPTATPTAVPVTVVTTAAVPTTPQVLIPQTGVWAEITYDKTYTGVVGAPGNQQQVTDTGDHFYRIPTTSDGGVALSVQKSDGSGDLMKATVYNNGAVVKTSSVTGPYGSIDMQISFATPTPTPTVVLTPMPTLPLSNTTTQANTTGNTTA